MSPSPSFGKTSRAKKLAFLVMVFSLALLCGVAKSSGAFRGTNGLIVYQALAGAHAQLFSVAPGSRNSRQLTHFREGDALYAAWSPDGNRIVFERDLAKNGGIYTMNADGSGVRRLARGFVGQPSWSPDGKHITFGRFVPGGVGGIFVMDTNGKDVRRIVAERAPPADPCNCAGLGSSVYSPSGKQIAFVRVRNERISAVFTVKIDGSGSKRLTPWRLAAAPKIDWSPDGKTLVLSSNGEELSGVSSNVYTVRANGTALTQLTHNRVGNVRSFGDSFSPDGTKIAIADNRSGSYQIYSISLDGKDATQVTHGSEAHLANWGTHHR